MNEVQKVGDLFELGWKGIMGEFDRIVMANPKCESMGKLAN